MVSSKPRTDPEKARVTITRTSAPALGLCFAAVIAFCAPALADQRYTVSGNDSYHIGSAGLESRINYDGTQTLHIVRQGKRTQFMATVRYMRTDQGSRAPARASFVQEMNASGEFADVADADPDYLTVLNQPFAIELDAQTLSDLLHLHGSVPFKFPSPITGGSLKGFLLRASIGRVSGRPVVGVGFDAAGPMTGPLPDHPRISMRGNIRMRGTAYYAVRGALLLALDETLTITGTLKDRGDAMPVTIVYKRSIRANDDQPVTADAQTPTSSTDIGCVNGISSICTSGVNARWL